MRDEYVVPVTWFYSAFYHRLGNGSPRGGHEKTRVSKWATFLEGVFGGAASDPGHTIRTYDPATHARERGKKEKRKRCRKGRERYRITAYTKASSQVHQFVAAFLPAQARRDRLRGNDNC